MKSYTTVEMIKGAGAASLTGSAFDTRLRQLLEDVTIQIDRITGRSFQPYVQTKYFNGSGKEKLLVSDLISIGTLAEDSNQDGTFDTVWSSNDYFLAPYNADPTSRDGKPYSRIEVSSKTVGTQDLFSSGRRRYEIVGTWGYSSVTIAASLGVSASLSASGTAIDINGSASGAFEIGQTILIGTEQMYIRSHTGTALTVTRGVNGATAGTHGSGAAISIYEYPGPIIEAVYMQASRLWKRKDAGFSNESGVSDAGIIQPVVGLDGDVKQMIKGYKAWGLTL